MGTTRGKGTRTVQSRVRSGCTTCRERRVKCDEGKPLCQRCAKAGIECHGYPNNWLVSKPGPRQTGYRKLRPAITTYKEPGDSRSMHFFLALVAPSLAEPCGVDVWQQTVPQLSDAQAVVRHAVLAISALYEDFHQRGRTSILDNSRALGHYNRAIAGLLKIDDEPMVLLACILFVCIEYIQGNAALAIRHCLHGIQIIRNLAGTARERDWLVRQVAPQFRRFSMMPSCFGQETFVEVVNVDDGAIPPRFASLKEAEYSLDGILVHGGRLHARGCHTPYARKKKSSPQSPPSSNTNDPPTRTTTTDDATEALALRAKVLTSLDAWFAAFDHFSRTNPFTPANEATHLYLAIRARIYLAGADGALTPGHDCLDAHVPTFREVASLGEQMATAMRREYPSSSGRGAAARFSFEMGPLPLLHFMVAKCPDLATRLRGLRLVKNHWADREGFYDREGILAAGRQIVELEHGVVLDEGCWPVGEVDWEAMPLRRLGHERMTLLSREAGAGG